MRARRAQGARAAAGRQIDLASRLHLRPALTSGVTEVDGLLEGDDVLRTGEACGALGARIERLARATGASPARGSARCWRPRETLDFGNAGTGSRLMMGVVGGHGITATFDGDASLRKRPMRRILDPLRLMGAQVLSQAEGGRCPIVLKGAREPAPDRLSHARRLGADQIGGAARRAQRARRDHGDRDAKPRATTPRKCWRISAPRSRSRPRARGGGSTRRPPGIASQGRSSFPPIRLRRPSRSSPR